MKQDPDLQIPKTFWYRPESRDFYLIPDDVELPPGELELRSIGAERRLVDAEAVGQWATNLDGASEYLAARLREGVMKFGKELGAAWRQGLRRVAESVAVADEPRKEACCEPDEGSRRPAGPGSTSETLQHSAEQAESIARMIESTATSIASGLRGLSQQLLEAGRNASKAQPAGGGDANDLSEPHSVDP